MLTDETVSSIASLQRAGFTILLGSNTRRNTDSIVEAMHAHVVRAQGLLFKPRKAFYRKAITEAGVAPNRIAMIGDHIINDVAGANRAGFVTILVASLSKRRWTLNRVIIIFLKKFFVSTL